MLNKKALAASVSAPPAPFVEDVFSTFLYAGNSSTQTITNGIDLATKGGLVWRKSRTQPSSTGFFHNLTDTARGASQVLYSNATDAQTDTYQALSSFNTDGFTMLGGTASANQSGDTYCSWTFAEQPKFFDVVTYTGNGTSGRTVAHNLGSVPGMIIIKQTDGTLGWKVYHRSTGNEAVLNLNLTDAAYTGLPSYWNSTTPTSSVFTLGDDASVNGSGNTFVAYLFAHDAGGFGTAETDNVISCGSFTSSLSSGGTINLGYEPQYILIRNATSAAQWIVVDSMRGIPIAEGAASRLFPNLSSAEDQSGRVNINATGFSYPPGTFADGNTVIYMAIRRPMKVPTTGTEVFKPTVFTGVDTAQTAGFPVDLVMNAENISSTTQWQWVDRLRGANIKLESNATSAEDTVSAGLWDSNTQVRVTSSGNNFKRLYPMFRRAPKFFDIVCYTGTGSARTVAHNLTVAPELMIVKRRNDTSSWTVYSNSIANTEVLAINTTNAKATSTASWNSTSPTSSVFTVGTAQAVNESGGTYVAYLFATCAGVSKVGSYTGNGSSQTINCGFTAGARFVLIKRTDSTGDWYVYDTARGMTLLTDPYLQLNSTAAESATLGSVTTTTGGFTVDASILAAINTNAASYIFLAIS